MLNKWFKKIFKEALKELLTSEKFLNKTLSKDDMNVVYIPVGKLPKSKSEEYIKKMSDNFKKNYPEYKILWLAVGN